MPNGGQWLSRKEKRLLPFKNRFLSLLGFYRKALISLLVCDSQELCQLFLYVDILLL